MKEQARLTSELLARKGFALPGTRPAHVYHSPFGALPATPTPESDANTQSTPLLDVEDRKIPDSMENSSPPNQWTQSTLQDAAGEPDALPQKNEIAPENLPSANPASTKSHAVGKRVAMTLRLDDDRHLKLRLVAAHGKTSCQKILIEALDSYLNGLTEADMPAECVCLREQP